MVSHPARTRSRLPCVHVFSQEDDPLDSVLVSEDLYVVSDFGEWKSQLVEGPANGHFLDGLNTPQRVDELRSLFGGTERRLMVYDVYAAGEIGCIVGLDPADLRPDGVSIHSTSRLTSNS